MKFFNAVISMSFKRDLQGNTLFFPNGVIGQAYIVPNAEKETEIRKVLSRFLVLILLLSITASLIAILILEQLIDVSFVWVWPISMMASVPLLLWHTMEVKQITKDLPTSDEKITMQEVLARQASWFKNGILWALLILSVFFAIKELISYYFSQSISESRLSLFSLVVFGGASVYFGKMLRIKKKQEKDI